MKQSSTSSGFTLIELAVILLVIQGLILLIGCTGLQMTVVQTLVVEGVILLGLLTPVVTALLGYLYFQLVNAGLGSGELWKEGLSTLGIVGYCCGLAAVSILYLAPCLGELPISGAGGFLILALLGSIIGPAAASPEPELAYARVPVKR